MPASSARRNLFVPAAAAALLVLMAVLMYASSRNDSITTDELPHVAAGYSYLVKADYRLNPEHPPLMKDLAAFPLLFMNLRAPWDDKSWTQETNGQWGFGSLLIFGNNADAITQAAKSPMILFTVALGWVIFWWTRKQFGDSPALLALFFYAFSPTFLAHGRLVTTDVGAAAGYFIGAIAFLRFLRTPTKWNVALAGLAMAFAFLAKYSTFGLAPIAILLAVAWPLVHEPLGSRLRGVLRSLQLTICVFGIALLAIYPVYLHHTWNFPPEQQRKYAELGIGVRGELKYAVHWASDKPVLRPWAEYLFGPIYVVQRSDLDKNSRYFWGQFYNTGVPLYFPFVYLVKEPLPLHILTIIVLIFALARIRRTLWRREWMETHFTELAFLVVIGAYWAAAIYSNLNIGVRHILPTFPFVYVLVASGITVLYRRVQGRPEIGQPNPEHRVEPTPTAAPRRRTWAIRLILGALLAWQAITVLRVHPSYLAYFNELAGGPDGGWRYVVDSNIDWGQDMKRLAAFVEQRGIPEIHLDFFGSAEPVYYLKEKVWGISSCSEPLKGWVAVSVMWYQHSREKPECDYRRWLPMEKLASKIGYSIFVFHIE
ncbi:MAG: glycosyltransferase family 39 protein [Acidobacteria bacterium]|nr:glycosyltransferase family 39 protein [Acidobacteriota bacterium]